MPLLFYTWLYFILLCLYFTLLEFYLLQFCFILTWCYFTLLESTSFYHASASLYLNLLWLCLIRVHSTTALLHSAMVLFYYILDSTMSIYFSLLESTSFQQASTSLYLTPVHFTMALLHSTWLYFTLLEFYLLQFCFILTWCYFTLLESTSFYHASASLYLNLLWLCLIRVHSTTALLHSAMVLFYYILDSTMSIYFSLLESTSFQQASTSLYLTPVHFTMALLHSTWLYHCSTSNLLHSSYYWSTTWFYFTLYWTLPHSTMPPLHCTWLYYTSQYLYLTLVDSTSLYHASTWLCLTLLHSTMSLLNSTWIYFILPWLHLTLLHSILPYYFPILHSTCMNQLHFTMLLHSSCLPT